MWTWSVKVLAESDRFTRVALVLGPHGLKGEVRLKTESWLEAQDLEGLRVWIVPPSSNISTSRISRIRSGPRGPLAVLEGITDIDTAQLLSGREVLIDSADAPDAVTEADDGSELLGYAVHDPEVGDLGRITETIVTGANDVWVVHGPLGEVLIPVIDEVVLDVDDVSRLCTVRLLDGLLPETKDSP